MGPGGKARYGEYDHLITVKERAMQSGSGSVSGSPGRMQDNVSRDSGIGGLKVSISVISGTFGIFRSSFRH